MPTLFYALFVTSENHQTRSTSVSPVRVGVVDMAGCYGGGLNSETDIDILGDYNDYNIDISMYRGNPNIKSNSLSITAVKKDGTEIPLFNKSNANFSDTKKLSRLLSAQDLTINDIGHINVCVYDEHDGGCGSYSKAIIEGVPIVWAGDSEESTAPAPENINQIYAVDGNTLTMETDIDDEYQDYLFEIDMAPHNRVAGDGYQGTSIAINAHLKGGLGTVTLYSKQTRYVSCTKHLSTMLMEKGINRSDVDYIESYAWTQRGGLGARTKVIAYKVR